MLKYFRKNTHLPKCGLTFYSNPNPHLLRRSTFTQNLRKIFNVVINCECRVELKLMTIVFGRMLRSFVSLMYLQRFVKMWEM